MTEIRDLLKQHFPGFTDAEFLKEIEESVEIKEIPAGETLMEVGQYITSIPLLVSGHFKVLREDEDGNELFLYHIYPGQACAISFVCSSNERISQIRAEAMDDCKVLLVPVGHMDVWMAQHRNWYQFVLSTFRSRFDELLKTVDSIAFHRMDERLLEYLRKNVEVTGDPVIHTTHQDIAYELNSSREVISRLLKKLEQKGIIKLGRNQILLKVLK